MAEGVQHLHSLPHAVEVVDARRGVEPLDLGVLIPAIGMSSGARASRKVLSSVNDAMMIASALRLLGSFSTSAASSCRVFANEGMTSYPAGEKISYVPCRTRGLNQLSGRRR